MMSSEARASKEMKEDEKPGRRPIGGFVIAGASLALLFGIAILKGRVR
jgi:hypothetical protein